MSITIEILDTNDAPRLLRKLANKLEANGIREIRLYDKHGKETCWLIGR